MNGNSGNSAQILGQITDKNSYTIDCSNNWKINQKNIVNITDICFDNSNNGILYRCEYHGLYYEYCKNENLTNNSPIKYCQCDIGNCSSCSNISFLHLEYDLYEVENNDNPNVYRICYKDTTGFYWDINDEIYKKCFDSCEKCEIHGNNKTHNCTECSFDFPLKLKINNITNYSNCYHHCSYYYYFDEDDNFHCTENTTCPKKFPILIETECQKDIKIVNMDENLSQCLNNDKTKGKEVHCYDTILKDIEDIFSSQYFDTSDIDNGLDQVIEMDKTRVILSTTDNQKNSLDSNFTTMDLGDCEQALRQAYNLSSEDKIYIKMLEISQEEMKVPKVEYDIYTKKNGKNLMKLSLNVCKNTKVSLLIPIKDVDNVDKLNTSSGYYNDLCYTATSDSGTDISLEDRKNEYTSNAACQDGCVFADYNNTLKKAKCSCEAKESSSSYEDMKIDKNKLLDNFKNIKNIVNVKLLKCIKVLFTKIGLSTNIGFYIFISIIIFHTII